MTRQELNTKDREEIKARLAQKAKLLAQELAEKEEKEIPDISEEKLTAVDEKRYLELLASTQKGLKALLSKSKDLEMGFQVDTPAVFYKEIRQFLVRYERGYLAAKRLVNFKKLVGPDYIAEENFSEELFSFPAKLEKKGDAYIYTLPEMCSKRTTEKSKYEANLLSSSMLFLQEKYKKEHAAPKPFDKAAIIFEHHIDKTLSNFFVPDPDNLDVKTAIDCLQLFLIGNDSLRDLSLLQYGIDDTISYTRLIVLPQNKLLAWLSNGQIFTG